MKAYPSYGFRNYLYKIGVINYSDFPKIHEDFNKEAIRHQIISLSHLLENTQESDPFGNFYIEFAERLYRGWTTYQKETSAKTILALKSLLMVRQKSRAFYFWCFHKPKNSSNSMKKSVDFSQDYFSSPSPFKHSQKASQLSYDSNNEIKNLLSNSARPLVASFRHSSSASFTPKPDNSLFNRLYEEADKKRILLAKMQDEEKDKGMEECTFHPEISDTTIRSGSVYERLHYSDAKEREEFYKIQKSQKELEGCTFHPQTNSSKTLSIDRSFDKLYKDAEVQRQKLRSKELMEKDRELNGCTFKPTVLNPSQKPSGAVYEKLYKSYQESQQAKRKVELERKAKESDEKNFVPKLLTPKREGDGTPVYARLYAEVEKRRIKLKKREDEKERERERSKSTSRGRTEGTPRYEQLYALHKEVKIKKEILKEKLFKETGASFKPDMRKGIQKKGNEGTKSIDESSPNAEEPTEKALDLL